MFNSHLELSGCQREVNMTFMQLRNFTLFVPFFIRAMKYAFGFAFGMIDYSNSGTVTKEEYETITHEKAM